MDLWDDLTKAMADLNEDLVIADIRALMDLGESYNRILMSLNTGVALVGSCFENGEYFIADLIVSGMIYRDALNILHPISTDRKYFPIGRVVIGVVEGDIHDVGKDIIVSLLRAERFDVIDLGVDVKPERFAYAVRTYMPDALLMSGVLSWGQESMKKTVDLLKKEELRRNVPILIGGLCANEFLMRVIDADSWAYDTTATVDFCKKAVEDKYGKKN